MATGTLLILARNDRALNRFTVASLREALNLKDFLEQTKEFKEILLFQRTASYGPLREWIELKDTPR